MWQHLKSPLVRISFGLTMLTIAILLVSDLLGLVPNTKNAELQSRKVIAESMAVQLSTEIAEQELQRIKDILRSVVERNSSVLSGSVRMDDGEILSQYGDHAKYWTLKPGDKSTPTEVQVPLYTDEGRWGSVELSFKPLSSKGREFLGFRSSFLTVILFMALSGFFAYLIFLKRSMRELNPDAVIPERVRKALDTLSEGLLIVDKTGYIVFSNTAFARRTGLTTEQLVGKKSGELEWVVISEKDDDELPWIRVLDGEEVGNGSKVRLKTSLTSTYTFTVNISPITASGDKIRGALITFDDITEIETKNNELRRTLGKLEKSQREISRQNQELQVLATRDPLTGALNRRSLFQGFQTLFNEAKDEGDDISCIMVDIDHFKSVNDRFGHAVGDKVIKLLAKILTEHSRPNDLVGRFGGEEFCVILPGVGSAQTSEIGERMRQAVQAGEGGKFSSALRITASFGVASLMEGVDKHEVMLERADKALYAAKEGGRNRVMTWNSRLAEDTTLEASTHLTEQQDSSKEVSGSAVEPVSHLQALDAVTPEGDDPQDSDENIIRLHPSQNNLQLVANQNQELLLGQLDNTVDSGPSHSMLLIDRIDQAIKRAERYATKVAVMVIDVDALQRVSDTLGLAVNNKLSKIIVTRIKQVLRSTDTVALTEDNELLFSVSQLGRSEIVVLLTDLKQSEIVTTILQRIFSLNNEAVEVEGNEFFLNSTIGVSLYPLDGQDPDILIRHASSAMREAKQSVGRNCFQFYADDINQRSKRQIRLEAELYRALGRDELVIYYQPKVDLKTGRILGMEALIRWQHPQLGLVPPNDFIPLAEQTGLIEEIGQWVLQSVCEQIGFWQKAGYGTVNMAINLSPVEFRHRQLAKKIIQMVDSYNIPPDAIEIEITETVVMQNMETAVEILEDLHKAGFRISVDDFGTGYSSLSYLKRFPLSKVKIDRSFISDFTKAQSDAAIVSAIIAMSHSLGLRVVAEGVETEEQLRFLQDLHCDEIQGYLISKPVSSVDASDLLAQSSSIQRMIKDYGIEYTELKAYHSVGSATGMIGVLNDFPGNTAETSR